MPRYYVKTIVHYTGEVEADSEVEAEEMGWNLDEDVVYDCVFHIVVEECE